MFETFLRRLKRSTERKYSLHVLEFATLRGFIVGSWAGIESCIDQANYAGWLYTGREIAAQVPVNFKRKVELFRRLHRDTQLMQPLAADADALLSALTPLLDDRHAMVHGYFMPDETDLKGWRLSKHVFTKDGVAVEQRYFTSEELNELSSKLTNIQKQATNYVRAITGQVESHFPQNRDGEIAS